MPRISLWLLAIGAVCLGCPGLTWSACLDSGVQVQVLGSGGPGESAGRASSAYLVWIDGVGRIMVDAGSGTKDQFHTAGGSLEDIQLLAVSHLHPDHSAELPAILWPTGADLRLAGPTGGSVYPSISDFLERLFGDGGAFQVLGARTQFEVKTVETANREVAEVWREGDIVVRGIGVPHGDVPAIGYRVDIGDASIVFSSDQNGSDPSFIDFARGVDILVIHMAVTEDAIGQLAQLHARPSVWGRMASEAEVGRVLVSHISTSSPQVLDSSLAVLRENYNGPVIVGEDLLCLEIN